MKTILIEERKLIYINKLLNKNYQNLDCVEKYFKKIDSMMQKIKIGARLYNCNCWGDVFEWEVTKIIDIENGIIEAIDHSIDNSCENNKSQIVNLTDYEINKRFIKFKIK